MNFSKLFFIILCVFIVSSCSYFKKISDKVNNKDDESQSVELLYNKAVDKLENTEYDTSIELFSELERTYPYSKWAIKAQLMSAYASYKDEKYDDALLTLERFTKLYPGNKDIAYAYYLRALSFYQQISDVTKDQSYSVYAGSALKEVIARFPDTKYANDASLKLDLVNDHLAGKEVNVGRFYLKEGNTIAAINRFIVVIEQYQTTSYVDEALHRLVEAYYILGVQEEAKKYAAVLGYNFPQSNWYRQSYELLEGKKLNVKDVAESDSNKGKWYDFTDWKGLEFIKVPFVGKNKQNTEDLIESIDNQDVEDIGTSQDIDIEDSSKVNVPIGTEELPEIEQATQSIDNKDSGKSNWFKNIFSKKKK